VPRITGIRIDDWISRFVSHIVIVRRNMVRNDFMEIAMTNQSNADASHSLAPIFRQLDEVRMSAAERERAKDYLRLADVWIDGVSGAWNRIRSFVRGPGAPVRAG